MAHGIRDYFIEIQDKTNAWNVTTTEKTWLLLRLNNFTGKLEYITTTINPENRFGTDFPSPDIGDTFFNLSNNRMFQWNGYQWVNIIQIIVATCENNKVQPYHTGTQVASSRVATSGNILQSKNHIPLRIQDGDNYSFTTEVDYEDNINTWKNSTNILLNNSTYYGIAGEYIPALSLLTMDSNGNIVVADNSTPFFAISIGNFSIGQIVKFITRGEIVNNSWLFEPQQTNKNLFCDENGQLTTNITVTDSGIIQKAGIILGRNIIDFYPQEPIYLNPSPTPSVTPTVSNTPTTTPTMSVTSTVTLSVTPTVTPTSTVTPTVTPSVTATVTPTVTPLY